MRPLPRVTPAALFSLGLLAAMSPALAADVGLRTSPGRPALKRDLDPNADEALGKLARKVGAREPGLSEGEEETIDQLRERLARRLAEKDAQDAKDAKGGNARAAKAQGANAKATSPKADAGAPPKASAPAAREDETLDQLRERLARRLGEKPAPAGATADPSVLRVLARPAAQPGAGAAALAVSPGTPPEPGIRWSEPHRAAATAGTSTGAPKPAAPKKLSHNGQWSYHGPGGPEHWADIKPEYALCSSGKRQSPIDIRDGISVQLDPVQFDYKASNFRVIDNGHTVQVNVAAGNHIEVMGRRYELQQFHFHRPSEERINGRQFDMVAHLVHKDLEGRLAVVAVLLDRGSAQPIVQQVWNNLPLEKHEELAAQSLLDLNGLLPAERGYFTYMGSLTTPPCSEGVLWMVMKHPVSVSSEQINIFSRLYPMNARPIQAASGRLIKGPAN